MKTAHHVGMLALASVVSALGCSAHVERETAERERDSAECTLAGHCFLPSTDGWSLCVEWGADAADAVDAAGDCQASGAVWSIGPCPSDMVPGCGEPMPGDLCLTTWFYDVTAEEVREACERGALELVTP